jgi:hypothetical protein
MNSVTMSKAQNKITLNSPLLDSPYSFQSPNKSIDLSRKGHMLWCADFYSNIGVFAWSDGTLQIYGGLDQVPMLIVCFSAL